MKLLRAVLFIILLLCLLPVAQPGKSAPKPLNAWLFVVVETAVHPVKDEDAPNERRFYMSNVIAQPESVPDYSLVKKLFAPYFEVTIMNPAEKRGIAIDFSDQDVKLNGETSRVNYETKAEAEEQRNKEIEYRKEQSGNIYSFEIDLKSPKGEETSKPKLIYRDKEAPNWEKAP